MKRKSRSTSETESSIVTLALSGPRFSGTAARFGRRWYLIEARQGRGERAVVLEHDRGVWTLSMPSRVGPVVLRPQAHEVVVGRGERRIAFGDRRGIARLARQLARDPVYRDRTHAFLVAAGTAMIAAERRRRIRFPILDDATGHASATTLRDLVEIADDPPNRGGWVGVDLPCFIPCMEDCERDVDWWEIWMHAYCLLKCGIKCGTGGSPL